jgi:hypothetical protein
MISNKSLAMYISSCTFFDELNNIIPIGNRQVPNLLLSMIKIQKANHNRSCNSLLDSLAPMSEVELYLFQGE